MKITVKGRRTIDGMVVSDQLVGLIAEVSALFWAMVAESGMRYELRADAPDTSVDNILSLQLGLGPKHGTDDNIRFYTKFVIHFSADSWPSAETMAHDFRRHIVAQLRKNEMEIKLTAVEETLLEYIDKPKDDLSSPPIELPDTSQ